MITFDIKIMRGNLYSYGNPILINLTLKDSNYKLCYKYMYIYIYICSNILNNPQQFHNL